MAREEEMVAQGDQHHTQPMGEVEVVQAVIQAQEVLVVPIIQVPQVPVEEAVAVGIPATALAEVVAVLVFTGQALQVLAVVLEPEEVADQVGREGL